jgi:uncharacterized protein involved in outer membrane biogenesis
MTMRRKSVILATVIAAAVIVAAALLLSVLVDPDHYRPEVISYLEAKTGKQVEVGHIAVNWIPLSIRLDDFVSKNRQPFPPGYFLKAGRIDAVLDAGALLHRRILIKSLVVHDPIINVISDPDGLWNFENPPFETSPEHVPIFAFGVISRVEISGGQLTVSSLIDPSDRPGPEVLEVHNLTAKMEGVDFDAFIGPGSSVAAQGDMKAAFLRFGAIQATNIDCKLRMQAREVVCSDARAKLYGGNATGDLTLRLSGKNPSFKTNAQVRRVDVDRLLAAFGAARGKWTGVMEGSVSFAGEIEHTLRPLAGMHGAGHVTVRNGQVPSIRHNENVMKLAHFNDLGPAQQDPSSFSSIVADLELADQRVSSRVIEVVGYGVNVNASGSFGVWGSKELDYHGVAEIVARQGFFTNMMARMSGATVKNGRVSIPFRVRGTIESPIFSTEKAVNTSLGNASSPR